MGSDKSLTIRLHLESFIPIPTDDVARVTFKDWKPQKIFLFMNILNKCQKEGYCFAGKNTLADECNMDKSTVSFYVREFIKDGYLKKGGFVNRVKVLIPTEKTFDRFFT